MVELLEQDCNQALETIKKYLQSVDQTVAVDVEQKLWKNIVKIYKENSNSMILINYLIGYYHMLHELLFFNTPCKDNFLRYSRYGYVSSKSSNRELLYNIHIRLGDLNRYVNSRKIAKLYYQRAVQIDPRCGIGYNQLCLSTPLTKAYQCLYYSIRAYHSPVNPVKNADANIRLLISRLDSPLFERFRSVANVKMIFDESTTKTDCNSNNQQLNSNKIIKIGLPESSKEWFYLIVISIHFNELNLSLDLLLDQLLKTIDDTDLINTMHLDYLLMSLDVALDWILKDLNLQSKNNDFISNVQEKTSPAISPPVCFETLKSLNQRLKFKDSSSTLTKQENVVGEFALIHNLILKDFQPLQSVYENMSHYYEAEQYQVDRHRKILVRRLIFKLEHFQSDL